MRNKGADIHGDGTGRRVRLGVLCSGERDGVGIALLSGAPKVNTVRVGFARSHAHSPSHPCPARVGGGGRIHTGMGLGKQTSSVAARGSRLTHRTGCLLLDAPLQIPTSRARALLRVLVLPTLCVRVASLLPRLRDIRRPFLPCPLSFAAPSAIYDAARSLGRATNN
jgi:hypothetical protein